MANYLPYHTASQRGREARDRVKETVGKREMVRDREIQKKRCGRECNRESGKEVGRWLLGVGGGAGGEA